MKKGKPRRKKSVNFKDEPEILQTPPKTAMFDKGESLKSVLKGPKKLKIVPPPKISPSIENIDPSGSKTERFNLPAPLLPPFKTSSLKDTLKLNPKKPVRNINIIDNFNQSINKAKSHLALPSESNPLKLPSIVQK